jgi:5-methylcytosine-specific restriction endonuclease McrA
MDLVPRRPCIGCGRLIPYGTWCKGCERPRPRGRKLHALRQAYVIGRPCAYCGQPAEHLDHIVPLSRGGTNHRSNLQALCSTCNLSKGDR